MNDSSPNHQFPNRTVRDFEPKEPGQRFFRGDDFTSRRRRPEPTRAEPGSLMAVLGRMWQAGEFHKGNRKVVRIGVGRRPLAMANLGVGSHGEESAANYDPYTGEWTE